MTSAEIDAVLSVLWNSYAIRFTYEDRALDADTLMWRNNGGLFPNHARYHSEKWKKMMGPDDPTVRGRRISRASMATARSEFEQHYRLPIAFALELVDRVRAAVADGVKQNGPSEEGEYEEELGRKAWAEAAADPEVRKRLAEIAREWCDVDVSSVEP